jgi:hypothetical protein
MRNTLRTCIWIGLFVLCVFLLTVLLYFLVTSHYSFGADFATFWSAGKAVFLEHTSPYSQQVSERIQIALYGRTALPGEDQVRYAYPPFSLLIISPAAFTSFAWANAYWMALNFILLFVSVKFAFPNLSRWALVSLVFFFPIIRSLILGQFALMLGISMILVYGLICRERKVSTPEQFVAGILLAWALMKPQLTFPFFFFFTLHAFRRQLWGVFYGLLGGGAVFALLSFWWVPNWIIEWRAQMADYARYVPVRPLFGVYAAWLAHPPLETWVGMGILLISALAVLWMLRLWWRDPSLDVQLLIALAIFGQIISPNPNSMLSDQVIFLLPVLVWLTGPQPVFRFEKPIWWGVFVLSAWIVFIAFFAGHEALQAEAALPLVCAIWLAWLLSAKPIFMRKTVA